MKFHVGSCKGQGRKWPYHGWLRDSNMRRTCSCCAHPIECGACKVLCLQKQGLAFDYVEVKMSSDSNMKSYFCTWFAAKAEIEQGLPGSTHVSIELWCTQFPKSSSKCGIDLFFWKVCDSQESSLATSEPVVFWRPAAGQQNKEATVNGNARV